jgi:hypothetical protein
VGRVCTIVTASLLCVVTSRAVTTQSKEYLSSLHMWLRRVPSPIFISSISYPDVVVRSGLYWQALLFLSKLRVRRIRTLYSFNICRRGEQGASAHSALFTDVWPDEGEVSRLHPQALLLIGETIQEGFKGVNEALFLYIS